MGHGYFDTSASAARAAVRSATGTSAFSHDAAVRAGMAPCLHPVLDVTRKSFRESRDNGDSPSSTPIAVLLDVTGSMGAIPPLVIQEAHKLMRLIKDGKIVAYPQICFGAIGDAYSDRVPIQLGEFEADDELAEAHLANIYLEGNGGGQNRESYDLPLYFFAKHVATDAWEKRREKGFLFLIGDENYYPTVRRDQVQQFLGVTIHEDIATATVVSQLREKWEVFLIRPGGTHNFSDPSIERSWATLLGKERVIRAEHWEEIMPQIAGTVSLMAGETLDATVSGLISSGFDPNIVSAASKGLKTLAATNLPVASGVAALACSYGNQPPASLRL